MSTVGERGIPVVEDLVAAYRKDPALHGHHAIEVLLYQGLWAVWSYRLAHLLWSAEVPLLPRLISQVVRALTAIEIHPGAVIGRRCFIDHGAGVVIGETAILGNDVMLYHGVTLGARGWWKDARGAKRHPTIGDNVTLGVGCTILGPLLVGANSRIGAHALVLDDVPAGSVVRSPEATYLSLSAAALDDEPRRRDRASGGER